MVFIVELGKKAIEDDLFSLANELAYRMFLSLFPFIIFFVSLLGFLNLEDSPFLIQIFQALPAEISDFVWDFVVETQASPSRGIISASLVVSIYSASNGFRAVIRGVNKAHAYKDDRSWIKKTALSTVLMFIFSFSIITMFTLWIFSNALLNILNLNIKIAIKLTTGIISMAMLLVATAWIYRLACVRKGNEKILPGACFTVILWAVSSEVFALFISRYSNISIVYGSIAGVFILMMWLNIISFILLLGNSVNAILSNKSASG